MDNFNKLSQLILTIIFTSMVACSGAEVSDETDDSAGTGLDINGGGGGANSAGNNDSGIKSYCDSDTGEEVLNRCDVGNTDGRCSSLDYNSLTMPNYAAFAVLKKSDGTIFAWGSDSTGGVNAPTDAGYKKIYSSSCAFAAIKEDGSISAWGATTKGGANAPDDNGYTEIFSNTGAFAALKADGSIKVWGDNNYGGNQADAPTDNGFVKIYSTGKAFAALKADGSIKVWGDNDSGGNQTYAPTDTDFKKIYSTEKAFAALKQDGSIQVWGNGYYGGAGAPAGIGFTDIFSNIHTFFALTADGSIREWGSVGEDLDEGVIPTDNGYNKIYSIGYSEDLNSLKIAIKKDGLTMIGWHKAHGYGTHREFTTDSAYLTLVINNGSVAPKFAVLKKDGSIQSWRSGGREYDFSILPHSPTKKIYRKIYTNYGAFTALTRRGFITSWGGDAYGGSGGATSVDSGYTDVYSTKAAFAAIKSNGTIKSWGGKKYGGVGSPSGAGWTFGER